MYSDDAGQSRSAPRTQGTLWLVYDFEQRREEPVAMRRGRTHTRDVKLRQDISRVGYLMIAALTLYYHRHLPRRCESHSAPGASDLTHPPEFAEPVAFEPLL